MPACSSCGTNGSAPIEPERDDDRPRYGIVKNLGSFNLVWAAFHEWVGIAKDVWARAELMRAELTEAIVGVAAGVEPRRQPRYVRRRYKERWRLEQERAREGVAWKKPISSSSGADQAERQQPAG